MLKGSTPAGKRRLTWRTPRVRHPGLRTRAPTLQSFNRCHQKASHLIQQSSNTRNTHRPGGLSTAGAQLPQVTRRRAHSELSMEIKVAHLTLPGSFCTAKSSHAHPSWLKAPQTNLNLESTYSHQALNSTSPGSHFSNTCPCPL